MKKIFITGAGGYIGSKAVEYFLEKGHTVVALDRYFFGDNLCDLVERFKDNLEFELDKEIDFALKRLRERIDRGENKQKGD